TSACSPPRPPTASPASPRPAASPCTWTPTAARWRCTRRPSGSTACSASSSTTPASTRPSAAPSTSQFVPKVARSSCPSTTPDPGLGPAPDAHHLTVVGDQARRQAELLQPVQRGLATDDGRGGGDVGVEAVGGDHADGAPGTVCRQAGRRVDDVVQGDPAAGP